MTKEYRGSRVLIRPIEKSDVTEAYVSWLNDPEVNQYLETRYSEQTLETVNEFVRSKIESDAEFLFAIIDLEANSHVGNIKLGPVDLRHSRADISLFIGNKSAWGKGFATEAIALITKFAFEGRELAKVNAGCYVDNKGSEKAFLKCGFEQEGYFKKQCNFNGKRMDSIMLGLPRSAYHKVVQKHEKDWGKMENINSNTEISLPSIKPVPLFSNKEQTQGIKQELMRAIEGVINSGVFILGEEGKAFERELAKYCNMLYGIGCASGSDALLLSLMAAGVGPGDEVILPSLTFFSTASCVQRVGATPVFVDVDPTYNLSLDQLESLFSPKTKAIIPVHLFGYMVDTSHLMRWVNQLPQKVYVIEDCAQSLGAECNGKKAGSFGDFGCFSFYPTKNLGGLGDGGLIVVKDENLHELLLALRMHGETKKYYHTYMGINSRLDEIQAACLRVKLKQMSDYERKREAIATCYNKKFEAAGLSKFITLPISYGERKHVWNQYTIRAKDRDNLRAFMTEKKIGTSIYYPIPLHLQKSFAYLGYKRDDLPNSELLAREVLSLPIYPEMPLLAVGHVVDIIKDYYEHGA